MDFDNLNEVSSEPVGYIYRPYITINGARYWAKWYGHRAWKIPVYDR